MRVRAAALSLLMFGCMTPYATGDQWGYGDLEVEPGIFVVRFKEHPELGWTFGTRTRVEDFAMLRCAEVTLDREAVYFTVLASRDQTSSRSGGAVGMSAPGSVPGDSGYKMGGAAITIQGIEFTIRISRTRPADPYLIVYDAAKLAQELREKYELSAPSESRI